MEIQGGGNLAFPGTTALVRDRVMEAKMPRTLLGEIKFSEKIRLFLPVFILQVSAARNMAKQIERRVGHANTQTYYLW